MSDPDIRWQQRFQNYQRALTRLTAAVELAAERNLSDLEKQGLIQGFEYSYELAWNTTRDFFLHQGEEQKDLLGSRDTFRLAFERGLLSEGQVWMDMIKGRQMSSHTYDDEAAEQLFQDICGAYHPALEQLRVRLNQEMKKKQSS